jgi:SAM-dependent methyltransferase
MRAPLPALALLLILPTAAIAQDSDTPYGDRRYRPVPGEAGKDVQWVPTPEARARLLLEAADTAPGDYVVDLGSGDGQWSIVAARRFRARAHGIEYNPDLVALARRNAARAGLAGRVTFEQGDLFLADFSRADVVTMYLLPELNRKLSPRLLALRPGTRIVSHCFDMGDWQPDRTLPDEDCYGYLWIVPAPVAGRWAFEVGDERFTAELTQRFQAVEASPGPLAGGRLAGRAISLRRADGTALDGEVKGATMAGPGWRATRLP